jgi:hypothetical protein
MGRGKCLGAWHGSCYTQSSKDNFPVWARQMDEDEMVDDEQMEIEDPLRFREARDGEHLMVTFQCDDCHFENCKLRPPRKNSLQDAVGLLGIRRANLDSMWARERSTVYSNMREGVRYLASTDECGWDDPYPPRGPFPVADLWGMKFATGMLLRSRDPGINSSNIQFETLRKMRTHLANFIHTIPGGRGATLFMTDDGTGGTLSNSPTNTEWFRRFMKGCHKRMGDVWVPDRALTVKELTCALSLLQEDWITFRNDIQGKKETCLMASTLISGFFAALRGEEIVRVDLGAMRKHWNEGVNHPEEPHVPLMLAGRFKREVGEKLFCQPLGMESKSQVLIALWFHRALDVLGKLGIVSGPMFRVPGKKSGSYKRASMGDLDPSFHRVLKRVQNRWPSIIPDTVNVAEEYSIFRSLRRGATSAAQNAKIPKEVIALVTRNYL